MQMSVGLVITSFVYTVHETAQKAAGYIISIVRYFRVNIHQLSLILLLGLNEQTSGNTNAGSRVDGVALLARVWD
jgi:hypothetical protein